MRIFIALGVVQGRLNSSGAIQFKVPTPPLRVSVLVCVVTFAKPKSVITESLDHGVYSGFLSFDVDAAITAAGPVAVDSYFSS